MKEAELIKFSEYIEEKGLKSTRQRHDIVRAFLQSNGHLSVEDLHNKVRRHNPKIGYATVYRTLKLLTDSGIAVERYFDDGQTRYEHLSPEEHHDHLICIKCGNIIEFEEKKIEALQNDVAREHGFKVLSHKLELYGYCISCNSKDTSGN